MASFTARSGDLAHERLAKELSGAIVDRSGPALGFLEPGLLRVRVSRVVQAFEKFDAMAFVVTTLALYPAVDVVGKREADP